MRNKPTGFIITVGPATENGQKGYIMERTIKFRINTHNVEITNAKTGEVINRFEQAWKPKVEKVIKDEVARRAANKLPYIPLDCNVTITTETREIDYSVFMANSRIVTEDADKTEPEA